MPNISNETLLERDDRAVAVSQKESVVAVGESVNAQKISESVFRPQQNTPVPNSDTPLPSGYQSQPWPLCLLLNQNESLLERIDHAATKTRIRLVTAMENVTVQKVAEAVLSEMQVKSWSDLGVQIQDVPSLNGLMVTEGKVIFFF